MFHVEHMPVREGIPAGYARIMPAYVSKNHARDCSKNHARKIGWQGGYV